MRRPPPHRRLPLLHPRHHLRHPQSTSTFRLHLAAVRHGGGGVRRLAARPPCTLPLPPASGPAGHRKRRTRPASAVPEKGTLAACLPPSQQGQALRAESAQHPLPFPPLHFAEAGADHLRSPRGWSPGRSPSPPPHPQGPHPGARSLGPLPSRERREAPPPSPVSRRPTHNRRKPPDRFPSPPQTAGQRRRLAGAQNERGRTRESTKKEPRRRDTRRLRALSPSFPPARDVR